MHSLLLLIICYYFHYLDNEEIEFDNFDDFVDMILFLLVDWLIFLVMLKVNLLDLVIEDLNYDVLYECLDSQYTVPLEII